ncbi:hypothetical protein ZIOFF_008930 [Zingiber officinale]|uniref:CST complex subunit STN1 n=1 Tax=Zingiber officinale TaxID=94328 RepID=A0A8J5HWU8_ZINOF|nr:hypothetical protein ZIOFF_008930 [Zingiber officinale]
MWVMLCHMHRLLVPSRLVLSRPISSCPVPSRLVPSRLVLSHLVLSRPVSSCPFPSRPVPSSFVSSRLGLSPRDAGGGGGWQINKTSPKSLPHPQPARATQKFPLIRCQSHLHQDELVSSHPCMQVWRLETVGVVVSKDRTGDFLKFVVDDGTGCIPCIIDLTDRSHLGLAAEVETERVLREAATVELGKLVRVRGKITQGEEGGLQLKVRDVGVEDDPNMEPLHWMDCIRLARSCYDRAAHP